MKRFFASALLIFPLSAVAASADQSPMTASMEMHHAMVSMCTGMDHMDMTEDADVDFASMMIPHHKSAVEMAQAYLKEGKDPAIREMAQKILESQAKEIAQLEAWLKAHKAR